MAEKCDEHGNGNGGKLSVNMPAKQFVALVGVILTSGAVVAYSNRAGSGDHATVAEIKSAIDEAKDTKAVTADHSRRIDRHDSQLERIAETQALAAKTQAELAVWAKDADRRIERMENGKTGSK